MCSTILTKAIDNIANKFEKGANVDYLGCIITIEDKREPYKFINGAGNLRTKSARYTGYITYPNGNVEHFREARGGAIARMCGIYVRE